MAAGGDSQALTAQLQTVLDVANMTLPEDQVKILKKEIQKTMDTLVGPSNSRKRNAVHCDETKRGSVSSSIDPRPRVPGGEIPTELLAGKFRCEGCSEWIALRDEDGFTLAPWLTHILSCGKSKLAIKSDAPPPCDNTVPQNASKAQSSLSPSLPVTSEIPTNGSVALHTTSTQMPTLPSFDRTKFFSPPFKAASHKLTDKTVSAPSIGKGPVNILPTKPTVTKPRKPHRSEAERKEAFLTDPKVAEVDPYRVLCAVCDKWIKLRNNSRYCLVPWECHKVCCDKMKASPKKSIPEAVALSHSSARRERRGVRQPSRSRIVAAEERRAALEADPHSGTVEHDRVLCVLCQKWVRLHSNSAYCRAQWRRHIKRCAVKHGKQISLISHSDIDSSEESSTGDDMAVEGDSNIKTEPNGSNSYYRGSYDHGAHPAFNDGKTKGSYYKTPPLLGPMSKKRPGRPPKIKGSRQNRADMSEAEMSYESEEA